MKRRSSKNQALYNKYGPARNDFLLISWRCAVCGVTSSAAPLSVHEICNGPNRMRAFVRRESWLATCWDCNSNILTDKLVWPIARQCAIKLLVDPEYFSLDVINEILAPEGHKNPPQVVSAADVLPYVKELLEDGYTR